MRRTAREFRQAWAGGKLRLCLCLMVALFGGAVALYFAIFPSRGALYYDVFDTLNWANATYESGKLIDPDFNYLAILPFGGNLLMLPMIAFFGYSLIAHIAGMALFIVVFLLTLWGLLGALELGLRQRLITFGAVPMLLSVSGQMRDNMWRHVIYYSLAMLLCMLMFTLILGLRRRLKKPWAALMPKEKRCVVLLLALLFLLCVGAGTDGSPMLVLCVIPVAGALVLERFVETGTPLLDRANLRDGLLAGVVLAGAAVGMVVLRFLRGEASAEYAELNMAFNGMSNWVTAVWQFFVDWCKICGVDIRHRSEVFSVNGVANVVRLAGAVAVFVIPVIALLRYRRLENAALRLLVCFHAVMSVCTFALCVFSTAGHPRRMQVMVFSAVLVSLLYLPVLWRPVPWRRVAGLLGACVAGQALLAGVYMAQLPPDYMDHNTNDHFYYLMDVLEDRSLSRVYGDYDLNPIAVLSKGEIQVSAVYFNDDKGMVLRPIQIRRDAYDDVPGLDRYAVVLPLWQYYELRDTAGWGLLQGNMVEEIIIQEYAILTYDQNPVPLNPETTI